MKQKFVSFNEDSNVGNGNLDDTEKKLTLQELLNSNQPIWVVNRTKEILGNPIYLVLDISGRRSEPIPPGPEPYCLTDKISKKKLEECDDLFRFIDKGVLKLVSAKEAEKYYKDNPNAKSILESKIKSFSIESEGGAVRGFKDLFGKKVLQQFQSRVVQSDQETLSAEARKPNSKLQWLIQGLEDGIIDENNFKQQFLSLINDLTERDKLYIEQHEKARRIYEGIKKGG